MENRVRLTWAGGEHDFALYLGELRALQQRTDAGPEEVLIRVRSGIWRIDDLRQTIRLGLIGGGMSDSDAESLMVTVFDPAPKAQFKLPAMAVLVAALYGVEDDQPGKSEGEEPSPLENGDGQTSTAPAP